MSKERSYAIKIPIFTSKIVEKPEDLFGGLSHNDMISHIHSKLKLHSMSQTKVSRQRKTKVQEKNIIDIECFDHNIGSIPSILLQFTVYETNHLDGFVETDKKITLGIHDKIGTTNNFVLLYPIIQGIDIENSKFYWLILVYEDPGKISEEVISAAKLVVNKILDIKIENIKLNYVIDELKKMKSIPELELKFSSISNAENDVDITQRSYLVNAKLKRQYERLFKNLPLKETEKIINNEFDFDDYQKREIKISTGIKAFKITREQKEEAKQKICETVEQIFNETIKISEEDLRKEVIYSHDFIIDKFTQVINKYMSNDGND